MTVTIKDIAKAANVSFSTVSKALNDSPLVKEPTKQMIISIAKEMGYEVNTAAKILATGKSNSVGIYCPDISRPEYAEYSQEISLQLKNRGFLPCISSSGFEDAKELFTRLKAAAVITIDQNDMSFSGIECNIHAFGYNEESNHHSLKKEAAAKAANLLFKTGHQTVLVVSEYSDSDWLYREFKNVALKSGNHPPSIHHQRISYNTDEFFASMRSILDHMMPDAVVCTSGKIAELNLLVTNALGLKVPEDLSIMGYDELMNSTSPVSLFGLHIHKLAERTANEVYNFLNQQENNYVNLSPGFMLNYTVKLQ
ncbi:LacI family DNA-binding transcriptional regulator [Jeotgalibacillus terrae]|uniref:LacI family DNA-binding transcriptional regulator n=1 Tax=Jeotgalibacillus terrae TaxID=587735 RepID=A0ABW5ZLE6_9BACL|nr:LacI family transcriptional regulator [Jeotgalibacillus terrae]